MIYDCFTFNEEFDLLRIRLEMMNDVADRFVIVEMSKTHRGENKERNFYLHKEEFAEYLDKIIYVCPDEAEIPEYKYEGDWTIEHFQRNCISKGLINIEPDDIIIVSDLDEIPNPQIFHHPEDFSYSKIFGVGLKKTIKNITNVKPGLLFARNNLYDLLNYGPVACEQDMFYYFMNCKRDNKWYGSVICKYKNMRSPQWLRSNRGKVPFVKNGGWHFSYFGGIEMICKKMKNIIDNSSLVMSITNDYNDNYAYIDECIKNGQDIYRRDGVKFNYINFDEIDFPDKELIIKKYPHFYRNL